MFRKPKPTCPAVLCWRAQDDVGEYNFIEPGVYAEDFNGDFNVIDNYPDLDGDGYGEVTDLGTWVRMV